MKKNIFIIIILLSFKVRSQEKASIEIPETYELSNIILALTDYGISDKWEVQKSTDYYKEVLEFFKPMNNHPLLDSVNYSRENWEDYLSFRTDAVSFSFDNNGNLKREFKFYTNTGHNPFDKNLDLIRDFVIKSNFRTFFRKHQEFYNRLINNYSDYNYIKETIVFLDSKIGKSKIDKHNSIYKIILSPLVYRMNCHRNLSDNIVADFPSATEDFVNGLNNNKNIEDRLNSNHLIFTEKDHEYINPITYKKLNLVKSNFDTDIWDNNSGYQQENSFNEYLTWAVYELFLEEKFPKYSDKLSTYWQYQNASRGFFAQNIFSEKVKELYKKKKKEKFSEIYEPLLKWTKKIERKISLPKLINIDKENFVKINSKNIKLEFSERMNSKLPFGLEIREFKDGKATGNKEFKEIIDFKWTQRGKIVNFNLDTNYKEFALIFNWWGIEKPLVSKNGVFLAPSSYILLKK